MPTMLVHIPVDYLDIENGPFKRRWLEAEKSIAASYVGVGLEFTLSSLASNELFKRKVKVIKIHIYKGDVSFAGVFAGELVEGNFDLRTRKGCILPLANSE